MKTKSAAKVLSALLYALLGFAGLATVLLKDRAQASSDIVVASELPPGPSLLVVR